MESRKFHLQPSAAASAYVWGPRRSRRARWRRPPHHHQITVLLFPINVASVSVCGGCCRAAQPIITFCAGIEKGLARPRCVPASSASGRLSRRSPLRGRPARRHRTAIMPRKMTLLKIPAEPSNQESQPSSSSGQSTIRRVPFSGLSPREVRILEEIISSDSSASECEEVSVTPPKRRQRRKSPEKPELPKWVVSADHLARVRSRLAEREEEVSNLEREVYGLKAKVTNLQDRVTELESELAMGSSENLEDNRCKICWVAERELILHPCTHMDLCRRCAAKMGPNCPWCRKRVIKVSKIYKL